MEGLEASMAEEGIEGHTVTLKVKRSDFLVTQHRRVNFIFLKEVSCVLTGSSQPHPC